MMTEEMFDIARAVAQLFGVSVVQLTTDGKIFIYAEAEEQ